MVLKIINVITCETGGSGWTKSEFTLFPSRRIKLPQMRDTAWSGSAQNLGDDIVTACSSRARPDGSHNLSAASIVTAYPPILDMQITR